MERTAVGIRAIQANVITDLLKAVLCEATVSKDDTVKIADLETLTVHSVFNATTGAELDHTVDDNIITITEDPCVNVKVFILCIG